MYGDEWLSIYFASSNYAVCVKNRTGTYEWNILFHCDLEESCKLLRLHGEEYSTKRNLLEQHFFSWGPVSVKVRYPRR